MSRGRRASFVLRVVQDRRGRVSGIVERVATGAKEAFRGVEAIGRVITRMLPGATSRGGTTIVKKHRFLVTVLATAMLAVTSTAASAADLNGAFSSFVVRPSFVSMGPSGVANECGVVQLVGLGPADWAYVFGPTFQPSAERRCFDVDGTFTITLHSDGSTISGPLTGVFCPREADIAHQHVGRISYGNPFSEDDIIQLENGTGQFAGLYGTASFHTFSAGAVFQGLLTGSLSR